MINQKKTGLKSCNKVPYNITPAGHVIKRYLFELVNMSLVLTRCILLHLIFKALTR
jgi:hypothetical protein